MSKVLVVDDDPDTLSIVETILTNYGFETSTFVNDQDISPKIRSFKPDLILLDNWLSDLSGIDVCKQIKGNPEFKQIPVIIFSAMQLTKERLEECNATDFVRKPFDIFDLVEVVKKHLKN